MTAAARLTLANVQRETFSLNPLQAAIMAAQIEAGPVETRACAIPAGSTS